MPGKSWNGELKITAVYPDASASPKDRNGHSLVLSVRYRDFTMLLTGDVGQTGEEIMLDEKYSPGREPRAETCPF